MRKKSLRLAVVLLLMVVAAPIALRADEPTPICNATGCHKPAVQTPVIK